MAEYDFGYLILSPRKALLDPPEAIHCREEDQSTCTIAHLRTTGRSALGPPDSRRALTSVV